VHPESLELPECGCGGYDDGYRNDGVDICESCGSTSAGTAAAG
jgi:hypothetical protein